MSLPDRQRALVEHDGSGTAATFSRLGGIVLCGGQSSRMGRPKAWLPFGGETMLQRVVRLLGQVVCPIVVVAAPRQELPSLPAGTVVAHDAREGRGPLEGLQAGLSALPAEVPAAYATSCDVPLLVTGFVQRLSELLAGHDVVVPVDEEGYHPLAAVYRTRVLPQVAALLAADQLRPVFLYEHVDTLRVAVAGLRDVDPYLDSLANVNRPQDYAAAVIRAGFTLPPEISAELG